MPLLDSFKVDHTKMNAPAVRVAKTMRTPKGDDITIFWRRYSVTLGFSCRMAKKMPLTRRGE